MLIFRMLLIPMLLAAAGLGAQTGGPGAKQEMVSEALDALIAQIQQAMKAGDIDQASDLASVLHSRLLEQRKALHSPSVILGRMEQDLAARPDSRARLIPYVAFAAANAGDYSKASQYAAETLGYATKGSSTEAQATYYGNQVLGMVALNGADLGTARQALLASIAVKPWPDFSRFGPNMKLAKALLDRGERETVLAYLERCKPLWPDGAKKLAEWQSVIKVGVTPDFKGSLALLP